MLEFSAFLSGGERRGWEDATRLGRIAFFVLFGKSV